MYSDETVYSIMLAKYSYIFSISIGNHPNALYRKLAFHSNSNRKPEYHRLFMADYDSQGNPLATVERTLIKHVVITEDEPFKLL